MATVKYNKDGTTYSCWSSTSRVTTPSLCFKEGSTTKYVPLLAISAGEEEQVGNYYFKVGSLCARHNGIIYRAVMSGTYTSSVSDTISTTITHSGKTGTSTTYQSKTVTASGSSGGGAAGYRTARVAFGVTFASPPKVTLKSSGGYVTNITTTYCDVKSKYSQSPGSSFHATIEATGQVATTTTTYPSETKSATAEGDFNYGVTYSSAPSLTVNSGGVTVTNNSDNASFHASKSLSGTVAYGKSATLSQAFTVSFTGAI